MTRFIGIASVKGGVGKTTTALNLATALSAFNDVVVVDAALSAPDVSLQLGISDLPVTLHEVLINDEHIREAMYKHSSGVNVIPGNIHFTDFDNLDVSRLKSKIMSLHNSSEVVVVDLASGLDDYMHGLKAIDELMVVTTSDWVSVNNAAKTIHYAEEMGVTVMGLVLNKVSEDGLSAEEIERLLSKPVLGEIPYDEKVMKAAGSGHPVVYQHPYSKASIAYKKLARDITGI